MSRVRRRCTFRVMFMLILTVGLGTLGDVDQALVLYDAALYQSALETLPANCDDFESDALFEEGLEAIEDDKQISSMVNDSLQDLEKQLEEALENENYELASKLRDEIKKRS